MKVRIFCLLPTPSRSAPAVCLSGAVKQGSLSVPKIVSFGTIWLFWRPTAKGRSRLHAAPGGGAPTRRHGAEASDRGARQRPISQDTPILCSHQITRRCVGCRPAVVRDVVVGGRRDGDHVVMRFNGYDDVAATVLMGPRLVRSIYTMGQARPTAPALSFIRGCLMERRVTGSRRRSKQ